LTLGAGDLNDDVVAGRVVVVRAFDDAAALGRGGDAAPGIGVDDGVADVGLASQGVGAVSVFVFVRMFVSNGLRSKRTEKWAERESSA
jgi:hypothetical protein